MKRISARRLQLQCLQSPARQWRRPEPTTLRFLSSSSSSSPSPSSQQPLYEKLFGGNPTRKARQTRTPLSSRREALLEPADARRPEEREQQQQQQQQQPGPTVLGDELRAWFEKTIEEEHGAIRREEKCPVVVVLQNAPRSLLETDFYRLARQGQHVDGWAAGITQVIQARSAITGELKGQYYLFFESRAAAEAYLDKVDSLYLLAAESVSHSFPDCHLQARQQRQPEPAAPQPPPELPLGIDPASDRDAALRSWTIVPPAAPLRYTVLTLEELEDHLKKAVAVVTADGYKTQSKKGADFLASPIVPQRLRQQLARAAQLAPLLTLPADASSESNNSQVLLHLTGSKIPKPALYRAIRNDELRRNLKWRMQRYEGGQGEKDSYLVTALQPSGSKIEWGRKDLNKKPSELPKIGFSRFILSFLEEAEARRFVRAWHRRDMVDERTGREMVVNATMLGFNKQYQE
ncbi:hypothetical protein MFIFM68171_09083 [Madurella fahalii]|uniref:Uncharacterized protein n=1 Tax=Madurella fahalii TaxID=1157608 RepID=A0ABQ0GM93_9PEZI